MSFGHEAGWRRRGCNERGCNERGCNNGYGGVKAVWKSRAFGAASLVAVFVLLLWSPVYAQTGAQPGQGITETTTRTELLDALSRIQRQLTELTSAQPEVAKGRLDELSAQLEVLALQLELEQELAKNTALTGRLAQATPPAAATGSGTRLARLVEQQDVLEAQYVIAAEEHDEICLGK